MTILFIAGTRKRTLGRPTSEHSHEPPRPPKNDGADIATGIRRIEVGEPWPRSTPLHTKKVFVFEAPGDGATAEAKAKLRDERIGVARRGMSLRAPYSWVLMRHYATRTCEHDRNRLKPTHGAACRRFERSPGR